ncbi:LytTr DNA-binding domain-containing protein [Larkinella arboricola]|uniref:LytTr DNA-binding domain-containing protein n=1 Tax=Larkinella arboricola TaxID=643671 RepID=A0A327WY84_LARAB|nr:LytTR family DNA-binding domain-containing protein [Larkinella arboricola]RAJ98121.1 LytTr DNA-binding domain-containing protein [Larkinella arboricola]
MLIPVSPSTVSINNDPLLQLYSRGSRQHFFQTSELMYLQGDGNYTWLHWVNRPSIIMPKTLKQLAGLLPAGKFIRVHRNSIVNCQYVERLERLKAGLGTIHLVNGSALPVSRRRWEAISELLDHAETSTK